MVPPTRVVCLAVLLGWSLTARAAPLAPLPAQPVGVPYPAKDWPTGSVPPAASAAVELALSATAARDPLLGETRAVVIVQGGRLIAERYMSGFGAGTPLISWSMAKSITQALVGIAVRQGLVDVDKPMGNPAWPAGDQRGQVTWHQWLNMVD